MHEQLKTIAARRGGVFTRQDALRCGYTADAIRHALDTGRWRALHKGVYVEAELYEIAAGADQHALRAAAAIARLQRVAVASHESTLLLHMLALYEPVPKVTLTSASGQCKSYDAFDVLVASLPTHHLARTPHGNLQSCSLARALVDVARRGDLRTALIPLENALRRGLVSKQELKSVLEDCSDWRGAAAARDFIEFAESRSESPAESLSRCMFREQSIEMPESQVWIAVDSDVPQYRVDFYWRRWRVIGEVDGKAKYDDPEERWQEKRREEELQDGGYEVVRWSYGDAQRSGPAVKAKILRAFARATRGFGLSG